jgi:hypothetical protein
VSPGQPDTVEGDSAKLSEEIRKAEARLAELRRLAEERRAVLGGDVVQIDEAARVMRGRR